MPVPAATLKKYVGVYREPLTDAAMKVELDKDGKTLRIGGQPAVPLSATTFAAADGSRQAVFEPGPPGAPLRMTESDGRSKPREWEAVAAFDPKPEELEAFAGTYYSDEIDMTYRLYIEGGKLKAWFRPAQRSQLSPIYTDAFETEGDIVRFTRDGCRQDRRVPRLCRPRPPPPLRQKELADGDLIKRDADRRDRQRLAERGGARFRGP